MVRVVLREISIIIVQAKATVQDKINIIIKTRNTEAIKGKKDGEIKATDSSS